jgi:hypothetical protein
MNAAAPARVIGRSMLAVVAGLFTGALLSIAVDVVLHWLRVFPPWGEPVSDGPLALATIYRATFSIFGCYVTARMAPANPMKHALILGAIGVVFSAVGAITTWNRGPAFAPHWYPVALVVIALPCAWLGGKVFELRGASSR